MDDKKYSMKSNASDCGSKLNICLISDYFYPNTGGVEVHMANLAYCLIERGHKVIVVTHDYEDRKGVRYLSNGLKVYYVPIPQVGGRGVSLVFPLVTAPYFMGVFRFIMISEEIQILHWHQSASMLGFMTNLLGQSLGIHTVLTNHSLVDLESPVQIMLTAMHRFAVQTGTLDHEIAVSHAVREVDILRINIPVVRTSVIPNAIDTYEYTPDTSLRDPVGTVNIVYFCRITYRKGADLLMELLPRVCKKYPKVHWIIGGGGDKLDQVRFLVRLQKLEDRVEVLGRIPAGGVCAMLNRGHIFLNSSITEAFCIAALEAAASGLLVVTTNVGGTPEVLPKEVMIQADPNWQSLFKGIEEAIDRVKNYSPNQVHELIKKSYSWRDVARRVEKLYIKVLAKPKQDSLMNMMKRTASEEGHFFGMFLIGPIFTLIVMFFHNLFYPASKIERAVQFPTKAYRENSEGWGDHAFDLRKNELKRN